MMSFYKDALLHKLQDENDKLTKNALYQFIDYYTNIDIDRLDMKLVADKFLKEKEKKND